MLWIVLAVFVWGLVHSLLAATKTKELVRHALGENLYRFYRLGFNAFAGISFLPVMVVMFLTRDQTLYLVPLPWPLFMIGGELLAVAALFIAVRQTGILDFVGLRQLGEGIQSSRLTTSGLYQYVRHPLYSAGMAFIWLVPMMTTNILAVNFALTVYIIIGATFEERKLRKVFGQEYIAYSAVTSMFIPFLKGNKNLDTSS